MSQARIHWRSIQELTNDPEFIKNAGNEFNLPPADEMAAQGPEGTDRRDFLKLMGFGVAAATLAACETPVKKAIPFLAKPEQYDPTIPNFYASSYMEDGEYCALVVKTREGRPIKLEGNRLSSITRGAASARVQASVLSLYDQARYRGPLKDKKATTWGAQNREIAQALSQAAGSGRAVYLVSQTVPSPSFKALIGQIGQRMGGQLRQAIYDPISMEGILTGNNQSFGQRVVPTYDFSQARTIVSLDADFLGTWLSPIEFGRQFAKTRKLDPERKTMSRLHVFEPLMSLTGANADERTPVRASALGLYALSLYNAIVGGGAATAKLPGQERLDRAAAELRAAGRNGLVVSGSTDPQVQMLVNAINARLGAYGTTIHLGTPTLTHEGDSSSIMELIENLEGGRVGAVIFLRSNPVYNHPAGARLAKALRNVTTVALCEQPDETADLCRYICPTHHYLESWGDLEPRRGYYSLTQPTIRPLFDTMQAEEALMAWAGLPQTSYYDFVRQTWQQTIYPTQRLYPTFREFWNYTLHDGIYEVGRASLRGRDFSPNGAGDTDAAFDYLMPQGTGAPALSGDMAGTASAVAGRYKAPAAGGELELVLYPKVGMMSGMQAGNPWLQEFPDPISRVTWENYLTVSPVKANELGIELKEGRADKVKLIIAGQEIELPALISPGQEAGTVGLAVGYGRRVVGKAGLNVGTDAWPLATITSARGVQYFRPGATIQKTVSGYDMGHVQTSHTSAGRPIVQEATLKEYLQRPNAGRDLPRIETPDGKVKPTDLSLWRTQVNKRPNHSWGMMIDLNSCIGCGACVIACTVENNVPVVGRQEVVNRREMHWLRIDRYYASDPNSKGLEGAAENPEVVFQPMLCQHCNNAPCETVCPVLATTHSTEGLNQMTYNRCIGTRYCANNCPYKVRRFNWFSYPETPTERGGGNGSFPLTPANSMLTRMVLNPDVTVRARGVMEKCSFCIQRIQEGKLNAKKDGRRPIDGEIVTACAQTCPTEAIVFGDMNDPEARVSQMIEAQYDERQFRVLDELNTRPSVQYLTKIRNKAEGSSIS